MAHVASPIVISGTAGSGTRAYTQVMEALGVSMGRDLTAGPQEPEALLPFTRKYTPLILEATRSPTYRLEDIPRRLREKVLKEFVRVLPRIRPENSPWGFKHPRILYLLPFLHEVLPEFSFLHVVRDGRDMALSKNTGPRNLLTPLLSPEMLKANKAVQAAYLWQKINCAIADWGEQIEGSSYHRSRFEDLCYNAEREITRLTEWFQLSVSSEQVQRATTLIQQRESLGRWRHLPPPQVTSLTMTASQGLKRLRYSS